LKDVSEKIWEGRIPEAKHREAERMPEHPMSSTDLIKEYRKAARVKKETTTVNLKKIPQHTAS